MALQKLRSPKIRRLSVVDQVSDSIKQSLLDQVWKEGDKLPSEGELAEYYGVNRLSVRMALQNSARWASLRRAWAKAPL